MILNQNERETRGQLDDPGQMAQLGQDPIQEGDLPGVDQKALQGVRTGKARIQIHGW
tara:strand:+ start:29 stop:199 length:171 start_codon:yes stop_codon:yes gene_type:complete